MKFRTPLRFVSYLSFSLGLLFLGVATGLGLLTVAPAPSVPATEPVVVAIASSTVLITGAGVYRYLAT